MLHRLQFTIHPCHLLLQRGPCLHHLLYGLGEFRLLPGHYLQHAPDSCLFLKEANSHLLNIGPLGMNRIKLAFALILFLPNGIPS